jgi:hypothetical protein
VFSFQEKIWFKLGMVTTPPITELKVLWARDIAAAEAANQKRLAKVLATEQLKSTNNVVEKPVHDVVAVVGAAS